MLWSLPKVKVKCWWTTYFSWHDAVLTAEMVEYGTLSHGVMQYVCTQKYWQISELRLLTWCISLLTWCNTFIPSMTWCSTPIPWHEAILSLMTWCSTLILWRDALNMVQYSYSWNYAVLKWFNTHASSCDFTVTVPHERMHYFLHGMMLYFLFWHDAVVSFSGVLLPENLRTCFEPSV